MDCYTLPIHDPLLLRLGTLLQTTSDIIGVETGLGKETVFFREEVGMIFDIQPSRRGRDYYRFKILCEQYIFVDSTLEDFKKWFRVIYLPSDTQS